MGDEPSVGQVAEALLIDPSTASRAIHDAVSRGYLLRRPCDRDRRRQRLQLTDVGRTLLARVNKARRDVFAKQMRYWSDEELEDLVSRLDRLLADFARLDDAS